MHLPGPVLLLISGTTLQLAGAGPKEPSCRCAEADTGALPELWREAPIFHLQISQHSARVHMLSDDKEAEWGKASGLLTEVMTAKQEGFKNFSGAHSVAIDLRNFLERSLGKILSIAELMQITIDVATNNR
ncbi:hypothetical protein UY3_11792 [Chelonia mydas]|uniref:Uncharacterized protein n=1 Tax=Chelonia mydas TaxID=8469 RepID=M7BG86_CHEMY|nr:hypothetical protein UY3_11792 [Chelonia mydas]